MLPRVADLRDRERIVFLFNTNHLASIDPAIALAAGRFDIVRCVLPPNPPERKRILQVLVGKADLPERCASLGSPATHSLKSPRTLGSPTLRDLVRRICVQTQVDKKPFDDAMLTHSVEVGKRAVNSKAVERFKTHSETVDRP